MPRQDLLQFARLAYRVAGHVLPPYGSKFAPKKFTQPSLLACLCLKESLKLDYRGLEALLASAAELRAAVGLRRAGFSPEARQEVKRAYTLLYRSGLNVPHALEAIERECRSEAINHLVAFVRASRRGICAGISKQTEAADAEEESVVPRKPH